MVAFQILFWSSLFIIFWAYLGYLLALKVVSLFRTKEVRKKEFFPHVSIIITAHNGEQVIRQKLDNTLALDYPLDKLEIIVVSDGSTDRTEQIVQSYSNRGIKLLSLPERHGKHFGQGKGIALAKGGIVVMTDATTFLDSDAVARIVRNFSDPTVGCVSGEDRVVSKDPESAGEGIYVKYEMRLRSLESQVNSLVGISGSFSAVRKNLCQPWYSDMSSDFYLSITSYMRGYRSVLEPQAIGYYQALPDSSDEFQRKIRTVVHGLHVLSRFRQIMNPFEYGFYSFQMLSHKLFRWLVPFCLVLLFTSNLFLVGRSNFYQASLICQCIFYGAALLPLLNRTLKSITFFKIPFFFSLANLSILLAWLSYLTGKRFAIWNPTKR